LPGAAYGRRPSVQQLHLTGFFILGCREGPQ
jgi:hypothetical protein